MDVKKTKWINSALFLGAFLIGSYFFVSSFNDGPEFMHAWAQADRLAIAQGFVDNGFDFFHPQSFIYNHDYQLDYNVVHETTITAVDFPLHEYIVGLLMWLFGTKAPWVFHLYSFGISLVGVFALIKTTELLNLKTLQRLLVVLFFISSPIFLYYQSNFLINIASLSYFILGFYNFMKWQEHRTNLSLFCAFFFMLIAALTRTTIIIGILALVGSLLIDWYKTKRTHLKVWIYILVALSFFVAYQFYKYQLKETYGSIFLTSLLLPSSPGEYFANIGLALSKWWNYYFTEIHYLVLLSAVSIAHIKSKWDWFYGTFITLWILGCLTFSIVLSAQFIEHNYYFFDTFYFPLLFLLMLAIRSINSNAMLTTGIVALGFSFIFFAIPKRETMRITGDWDFATETYYAYNGSDEWLDSIGIPRNAKILAFDAYTPNSPFIGMQRKGFAVNSYSPEILKNVFQWDSDFVTYQNNFFLKHLYPADPEFINRFELIGTNGRISICKERDEPSNVNLDSFLGLTEKQLMLESSILEDSANWKNIDILGIVRGSIQFGPTFDFSVDPKPSIIYIDGLFDSKNQNFKIILALSEGDELIDYKTYSPTDYPIDNNSIAMKIIYTVPPSKKKLKGNLYIYNESSEQVVYKNLGLKIYNLN